MTVIFLACESGRCIAVYNNFEEALERCLQMARNSAEETGRVDTFNMGAKVRFPKNMYYHVEERMVFGPVNQGEEEVK